MSNQEGKELYILQSVENALKIIDILSERGEMGISEISRELGIGKSTAFRLIATLKSRGFVTQSTSNEKYSLSTKFIHIGSAILGKNDLISIARPYLLKLSEKYGEASHLVVLNGSDIVFIDKVNSRNISVQMHSTIGARMPAYCTGTGKLLLAYCYKDNINEYLKNVTLNKFTTKTIVDKEELKKELEKIRANGFSQDDEEKEEGLYCLAAPIKNSRGKVVAAVSISGPSTRMKERKQELIDSIKETGEHISSDIGWLE